MVKRFAIPTTWPSHTGPQLEKLSFTALFLALIIFLKKFLSLVSSCDLGHYRRSPGTACRCWSRSRSPAWRAYPSGCRPARSHRMQTYAGLDRWQLQVRLALLLCPPQHAAVQQLGEQDTRPKGFEELRETPLKSLSDSFRLGMAPCAAC